ncbi:MAG: P1 family peptidase [Actinomycetota bacterium]|nr:P1 family peptidase [Actinomycetota bacterium]
MITDVPGVLVGHWTDVEARTGCTVVVFPKGSVASGEIRGGAPATREFALLDPLRTVATIDAVVLSGGSAFGLAAGTGVVEWLEEQGRGFKTAHGRVPIVVGMSLYDLGVGDGLVRPTAANGRAAAESASSEPGQLGSIGAGTGATVGKWAGRDLATPGGLGAATYRSGELIVSALIAVNAVGFIDDGTSVADIGPPASSTPTDPTNTTIGVIVTNAKADKTLCHWLAQSGHDGLSRSLLPAHTSADGDALVAVATGEVEADSFHLRLLAQQAVAAAVRSLATH